MRIKFSGTCLECGYELGGRIIAPGFIVSDRFPAFMKSHCPECHKIIISDVFSGTANKIEIDKEEEEAPSKTQVISGIILDHFTEVTKKVDCIKENFFTTTDVFNVIVEQHKKLGMSLKHVGLALRQLGSKRVKVRGIYGWYLLKQATPEA